jgi:hypothetical protein
LNSFFSVLPALSLFLTLMTHNAATFSFAQTNYKGIEEKLPKKVAAQPFPFSHNKHAGIGADCAVCHTTASTKERAGLPDIEACMACHDTVATTSQLIRRLSSLHKKGEGLSWVRVYQVPDFVFFSHRNHDKAGIECVTCHGPVEKRNILAKEISTSMITCMNCHAEKNVSNDCYLCHDLGQ